jgi:hypothetical protein
LKVRKLVGSVASPKGQGFLEKEIVKKQEDNGNSSKTKYLIMYVIFPESIVFLLEHAS